MPILHRYPALREVLLRGAIAIAWRIGLIDPPQPPPPQPPPKPRDSELPLATQRAVFDTLRLLLPQDLVGLSKCRIGGDDDGGYVMVDCIGPAQAILSIGVGPDVSFDLELAQAGHPIVMFDHTVDALPAEHPNFTWHRLGIGPTSEPGSNLRSLADLADMLPSTGADPILKMDVEGAEWEALAASSSDTLRRFSQIAIEVHDLLQLDEPAFNALATIVFEKLAADFVLVHVHGNNCGPRGYVGGFASTDVLELTYLRRDLAQTVPSTTWYPTSLDRSNWRGGLDFRLWYFPFAPGSEHVTLNG